jgi:hypothetical protein
VSRRSAPEGQTRRSPLAADQEVISGDDTVGGTGAAAPLIDVRGAAASAWTLLTSQSREHFPTDELDYLHVVVEWRPEHDPVDPEGCEDTESVDDLFGGANDPCLR